MTTARSSNESGQPKVEVVARCQGAMFRPECLDLSTVEVRLSDQDQQQVVFGIRVDAGGLVKVSDSRTEVLAAAGVCLDVCADLRQKLASLVSAQESLRKARGEGDNSLAQDITNHQAAVEQAEAGLRTALVDQPAAITILRQGRELEVQLDECQLKISGKPSITLKVKDLSCPENLWGKKHDPKVSVISPRPDNRGRVPCHCLEWVVDNADRQLVFVALGDNHPERRDKLDVILVDRDGLDTPVFRVWVHAGSDIKFEYPAAGVGAVQAETEMSSQPPQPVATDVPPVVPNVVLAPVEVPQGDGGRTREERRQQAKLHAQRRGQRDRRGDKDE